MRGYLCPLKSKRSDNINVLQFLKPSVIDQTVFGMVFNTAYLLGGPEIMCWCQNVVKIPLSDSFKKCSHSDDWISLETRIYIQNFLF